VVPLVAAVALALPAPPASAKSLFVIPCDESSDADEAALVAAVNAANDETDHPGEDVIQLSAGCTYILESPAAGGFPRSGLPVVTSPITVWGNGAVVQGPVSHYDVDNLFWVGDGGDLDLQDMTITRNRPTWVSGESAAVYNRSGYLTVERVTLEDLTGEAMVASGESTTVKDSVFRDNEAVNYHGAAISAYSSLIVQNTLFDGNRARSTDIRVPPAGGAVYAGTGSGVLITGSTFTGNSSERDGGAIYNNGTMAVTRSSFTGNSSTYGGPTIENLFDGSITVTQSFFGSNRGGDGGGILSLGSASVANSTFYDNEGADYGGAISARAGSLAVTSSTFASNSSARGAGAIRQDASVTGQTRFSVFAGMSADGACYGVQAGEGNVTDAYDATCPGNFQIGDPKLQPPALNGGTTKTMRLGAGSYAAEHVTSGCPTSDQRGYARPSGAKCDAGAYEDQAPTAPGTPSVTAGSNPSKTGTLTLGWAASTDADDTVSYRLLHKDADDASYSVVGTTSATSFGLSETAGTWSYVVEARDGNHAVASGSLGGVVIDTSAPATPTVSADRAPDYAPASGTSWYKDTTTVTTTANGDPALPDGSAGSGIASVTPPSTYSTSGAATYTGYATDVAGNGSLGASLTVNVDAEAPTAGFSNCPSSVLLKHAAITSWTASDPSSGLASASAGSFTLDTATIGHKSVSTTATDHVGHSTTITCGYDVIYDFGGFYSPLVNPPSVQSASAGQRVPISFSLAGNQGLGVIAAGYPQSVQVPCNAFGAQTSGTPTVAIKPGLVYASSSGGRYSYVWATSTSWRGTCRQLVLKLNDGTYHRANLSFG
jgi:predicted outer membrane repeat protein